MVYTAGAKPLEKGVKLLCVWRHDEKKLAHVLEKRHKVDPHTAKPTRPVAWEYYVHY